MGIESTTRCPAPSLPPFSLSLSLPLSLSFPTVRVRVYTPLRATYSPPTPAAGGRKTGKRGETGRGGVEKREEKYEIGAEREGQGGRGLGIASCIGEHERSRNNAIGGRASAVSRVHALFVHRSRPLALALSRVSTSQVHAETEREREREKAKTRARVQRVM